MRSKRGVIGSAMLGAVLVCAAVLGAATLGGSGTAAEPGESEPRSLLVGAATGVGVVHTGDGTAFEVSGAIASPDRSRLVRAVAEGGATRVEWVEPSTGRVTSSHTVTGSYRIGAVAGNGRRVALVGSELPRVGSAPAVGRRSTPFVIVTASEDRPVSIEVAGNLEPEAFTTDGRSLFVAQYDPPMAPVAYQVRRLDLRTGRVHDVRDIHGEGREPMPGAARAHVYAPDGRRLYTFYAVAGSTPGDRGYAFVHVLDLDEGWAHCVPLPAPFGVVPDDAVAIAVAPDGSRVYVADHTTRSIAAIDTQRFETAVKATMPVADGSGPIIASVSPDGTVFVATGGRVTGLESGNLARRSAVFDSGGDVAGLQFERDRLYVRVPGGVEVVDPRSGARLRSYPTPSLGDAPSGGPPGSAVDPHGSFQCAC
jgi:hypothetical protein